MSVPATDNPAPSDETIRRNLEIKEEIHAICEPARDSGIQLIMEFALKNGEMTYTYDGTGTMEDFLLYFRNVYFIRLVTCTVKKSDLCPSCRITEANKVLEYVLRHDEAHVDLVNFVVDRDSFGASADAVTVAVQDAKASAKEWRERNPRGCTIL